jgi:probable F420-dependent oxidoreductase
VRVHDTLDPFVTLGYAAAATSRLRLLTCAVVAPYRSPFLTAKAAATVDVLSGGRLILGVATGYVEAEFDALGIDFSRRNELTDEAIELIVQTWLGEPVHHRTTAFVARGNRALPTPLQRPRPPIWVGGNSRRAIRRAVALGDGWLPFPNRASRVAMRRTPLIETVADLRDRIAYAREYAAEIGRTTPLETIFPLCFEETWRRVVEPERLLASAAELGEIGVTYFTMQIPASSPEEFCEQAQQYSSLLATAPSSALDPPPNLP